MEQKNSGSVDFELTNLNHNLQEPKKGIGKTSDARRLCFFSMLAGSHEQDA
jgi:hypothetical protein